MRLSQVERGEGSVLKRKEVEEATHGSGEGGEGGRRARDPDKLATRTFTSVCKF